MNKPNPWTFIGQEALREQRAHELSFIEKCRVHDELWESAKLFKATSNTLSSTAPNGLKHLHNIQ